MLKEKIVSGEIPVGERLPPASVLAQKWHTNYFTVHTALATLAKEGLIKRVPRLGTFVQSRPSAAALTLGVYYHLPTSSTLDLGFVRAVKEALQKKWALQKGKVRVWIDGRSEEERKEPLPDLTQAIQEKSIQGLAVLSADSVTARWLKKLPVPTSFIASGNLPNRIGFDTGQFLTLALDHLKEQGCRTVGLITNIPVSHADDYEKNPHRIFYDDFIRLCGERGFPIRNEWVRSVGSAWGNFDLFGYSELHKMWRLRKRPDGLIVYSDLVALGALQALVETSPPWPKLVLHRHRGVDLPFPPVPATWIETSIETVAEAVLKQIEEQTAGRKPSVIQIPYVLQAKDGKKSGS